MRGAYWLEGSCTNPLTCANAGGEAGEEAFRRQSKSAPEYERYGYVNSVARPPRWKMPLKPISAVPPSQPPFPPHWSGLGEQLATCASGGPGEGGGGGGGGPRARPPQGPPLG